MSDRAPFRGAAGVFPEFLCPRHERQGVVGLQDWRAARQTRTANAERGRLFAWASTSGTQLVGTERSGASRGDNVSLRPSLGHICLDDEHPTDSSRARDPPEGRSTGRWQIHRELARRPGASEICTQNGRVAIGAQPLHGDPRACLGVASQRRPPTTGADLCPRAPRHLIPLPTTMMMPGALPGRARTAHVGSTIRTSSEPGCALECSRGALNPAD
jgi:hypothetical protein